MPFALPSFFEVVSDDMLGDACHDLSYSRNPQAKFLGALDIYLAPFLRRPQAKCLGTLGVTLLFFDVVSGEMLGGACITILF